MSEKEKLRVYFDGACHLCSREVRHYAKLDVNGEIEFVNIAATHFSPENEGLDKDRVNAVMHVRTKTGEIKTGVDAFIEIWKIFPRYHWAARLALRQPFRLLLKLGYSCFAHGIRPFLPKRHGSCDF